jgi:hypothetical protein
MRKQAETGDTADADSEVLTGSKPPVQQAVLRTRVLRTSSREPQDVRDRCALAVLGGIMRRS